jgi:hypothetical protein
MNEAIPIDEDFISAFYTTRLIILLEDSPQSNKYRQLILTPAQFKVISDVIGAQFETISKEKGRFIQKIKVADDITTKLPDNLQDFYIEKNANSTT